MHGACVRLEGLRRMQTVWRSGGGRGPLERRFDQKLSGGEKRTEDGIGACAGACNNLCNTSGEEDERSVME